MKFIAVQGCTVNVAPAPGSTGVYAGGPPTQVTPASLKCKAGGAGMLLNNTQFLIVSGTVTDPGQSATGPDPAPHPAIIPSTATKNKAEGQLVLLEGDYVDVDFFPLILAPPAPPTPVPLPTKMRITIQSTGQTKVKAI